MKSAIADVEVLDLRQIPDERGRVMHMLRSDSPGFTRFGEVYFSLVNPGVVKAWKRHLRMTQNLAVPIGEVRFVLFDDRPSSATRGALQEVESGQSRYRLLRIPPGIWYGFKALSPTAALIANCADLPHDPEETARLEPADPSIPYDWSKP